MRRWFALLAVILVSGSLTVPVLAQAPDQQPESSTNPRVLGTVTNGNATILFEAANRSDINSQALATWDDFASDHPRIARTLAFKPSLMDDPGYLRRNPALNDFFQEHPDVRDAMAANPGNFAAIPPRPGE